MNLLVLAAFEPELTRFRALIAGRSDVTVATVGVGLVEAALGTARAIADAAARGAPVDGAVLLGTCGAYPGSGLEVGVVTAPSVVRVTEGGALGGAVALLPAMPQTSALDPALQAALVGHGAQAVMAVNTLGVTVEDAWAETLGAVGAVEHLEVFGFARACEAARIPSAAVLAVANPVGAAGRQAWKAHHEAASARAADLCYTAFFRTSTTAPSPGRE